MEDEQLSPELEALIDSMVDGPEDEAGDTAETETETPAPDEASEGTEDQADGDTAEETEDEDATEATDDADEAGTEDEVEETPVKALEDADFDRTATIKVNGEEKSVTVKELIQQAELAGGAYAKFEEAKAVRAEAEAAVQFQSQFAASWEPAGATPEARLESRTNLLTELAEGLADPAHGGSTQDLFRVWAGLTNKVAALGAFSLPGEPSQVAASLGFNEVEIARRTSAHYQEKVAAQQRATTSELDEATTRQREHDRVVGEIQAVVSDAGLDASSNEDKLAYAQAVISYGETHGITDLHRAHARYRAEQVRTEATRQSRVAAAVSTTPLAAKRTASASVRPSATGAAAEKDNRSAEERAYDRIIGKA